MLTIAAGLTVAAAYALPAAHADNRRLNDSVIANVYTVQHQAGCINDVKKNPQLQLAAEWHTRDVLNNRALDGDIGTDSSTPQDRANATGFRGRVAQTLAINPALAITGIEIMRQWYSRADYLSIMQNCAYTAMGVWSEHSLDRTVVVAVYGQPEHSIETADSASGMDPNPDYDASDELEYGISWLPWILRGVFPPPAYPPQ